MMMTLMVILQLHSTDDTLLDINQTIVKCTFFAGYVTLQYYGSQTKQTKKQLKNRYSEQLNAFKKQNIY